MNVQEKVMMLKELRKQHKYFLLIGLEEAGDQETIDMYNELLYDIKEKIREILGRV